MRSALAVLLGSLLSAGCASTLAGRSTAELYDELMDIRTVSFFCQGSALHGVPGGDALERRLAALRPWLPIGVGAGEYARIEDNVESAMGTLDVTRCPTAAEPERPLTAFRRRLAELERRSRLQP